MSDIITKIKLNIVGVSDEIKVTAKQDMPNFKIYVGDVPIEDDPNKSGEFDVFENQDGARVLDEEYSEQIFAGDEEETTYQLNSTYGDSEGVSSGSEASADAAVSAPVTPVATGSLPPATSAGGSGERQFQKSRIINGVKVLNGELPKNLVKKALGVELEIHAANKLIELNAKFKEKFGKDIKLTGGNRSFEVQNSIFDWDLFDKTKDPKTGIGKCRKKPPYNNVSAAKPGTSQHGWGLAIDISMGSGKDDFGDVGNPQFDWMDVNATKYGWINPAWAKKSGPGHEPWHWEYTGGDSFKNDGAK